MLMKYYWFIFLSFLILNHTCILNKSKNIIVSKNEITKENKEIKIKNCIIFDENKSENCLICEKGFYLFKGNCYDICPGNFLADNKSMKCKKFNSNPNYIKPYSFSRCLNKCGQIFNDCSCNKNCRKSGDCCSDFKFCEIIEKEKIKSNKNFIENCEFSTNNGKICLQCVYDFYLFENNCVEKCPKNAKVFEENKFCLKNNCKFFLLDF
jgi:hypothetical protein